MSRVTLREPCMTSCYHRKFSMRPRGPKWARARAPQTRTHNDTCAQTCLQTCIWTGTFVWFIYDETMTNIIYEFACSWNTTSHLFGACNIINNICHSFIINELYKCKCLDAWHCVQNCVRTCVCVFVCVCVCAHVFIGVCLCVFVACFI